MGYQEIKLELPDVPKMKLKGLFLGHFLLISWATLGQWAEQVIGRPLIFISDYFIRKIIVFQRPLWRKSFKYVFFKNCEGYPPK